jgi:hypothetical protein
MMVSVPSRWWSGSAAVPNSRRWFVFCLIVATIFPTIELVHCWGRRSGDDRVFAAEPPQTKPESNTLRGRVVWAAEVLEKRGARSVPEAEQRTLALETADGELIPILEDVRGRGFRTDERLREMDLELLVRRLPKSPFVQILGVYQWEGKRKLEIDYWCQVCAIAMVERKPCDCCQGETELRKRRVSETSASKP